MKKIKMNRSIEIPKEVLEDLMRVVDNDTFTRNYIMLVKDLFEKRRIYEREISKINYTLNQIYQCLKKIDKVDRV